MALLDDASRKSLLMMARAAIARAIGAVSVTPVADPIPESRIPNPWRFTSRRLCHASHQWRTARLHWISRSRRCRSIEVVERCAVSAAISDPRFPPLSADEWSGVDLEISVLGPIERVDDIREVVVGRDGLIVEFGRRRGLLLPQVAVEWKWDASEFAAQTCIKAGLPRDAWQKGAKLFKFEAEVFGETGDQENRRIATSVRCSAPPC